MLHPFAATTTVGDLVWVDSNGNGLQDAGEPGLAGVVVQLHQGSTVVASTTTSSSGYYSFSNVAPGTYSVVFQAPSGYNFSPAQQGSNPALDSDVVNTATGETGTFTVAAGQINNNVDAGLVPGAFFLPTHPLSQPTCPSMAGTYVIDIAFKSIENSGSSLVSFICLCQ